MKRKLIAILMITSIIGSSLLGCGNGKAQTEQTDSQTSGPEDAGEGKDTPDATAAAGDIDWWKPYDEPVTLTTVRTEYTSAVYPDGDDITSNVWTRAYLEKFNINVETLWVSDEYDTKLNLDITSGNIPDVFTVTPAQLQQLVEADMLMDLTEIFDTYASDRLKGYMNADYESYISGITDGSLYGLANMHWGIIDQPDYIWIRQDWMEELGLKGPETMEELKEIMLAFMDAYGGYGIAIDQSLDFLNLLDIAWGGHWDLWYEDETTGELVYGSVQPEMKEALAEYADWYSLGIINPDFATTDNNAMQEAVVSGRVGVQPYYQWWGYNPGVDTVANLGTEAVFYPYHIPSANGEEVLHSIYFANGSYTVVNKNCENPEAVIKLLNFYGYMVDDAVGVESEETISEFLDNDIAHVVGAFRILNPDCDYQQFAEVSNALATNDTSNLTTSGMWQKYNNSVDFIENGTPGATGDYLQQGSPQPAYGLATEVLDNEAYIKAALWGPSPESLLNYGSTLKDILIQGYTKIIMGVEDVDYFDTLVAEWEAAGGATVVQEMNDMYGN